MEYVDEMLTLTKQYRKFILGGLIVLIYLIHDYPNSVKFLNKMNPTYVKVVFLTLITYFIIECEYALCFLLIASLFFVLKHINNHKRREPFMIKKKKIKRICTNYATSRSTSK